MWKNLVDHETESTFAILQVCQVWHRHATVSLFGGVRLAHFRSCSPGTAHSSKRRLCDVNFRIYSQSYMLCN